MECLKPRKRWQHFSQEPGRNNIFFKNKNIRSKIKEISIKDLNKNSWNILQPATIFSLWFSFYCNFPFLSIFLSFSLKYRISLKWKIFPPKAEWFSFVTVMFVTCLQFKVANYVICRGACKYDRAKTTILLDKNLQNLRKIFYQWTIRTARKIVFYFQLTCFPQHLKYKETL